MKTQLTSFIITSYNQATTLELLLESLMRQTCLEFDVWVADDGSSDQTSQICQKKWPFPLNWVTQEDLGYRKSKILNQAIKKSQGDYFIFLDADVILEKHFVQDHIALRKENSFVCGRRVDLGPEFCRKISKQQIQSGEFDHIGWRVLQSALKKDTQRLKRGLRIPFPWVRRLLGYFRPIDILGSNLGVWRSDLESVNGFNEALESYWGEDGDLFIRLRNSGKTAIGAKGLCIQYHIFHPRRAPDPHTVQKVQDLLEDPTYRWASRGLV